MVVKYLLFLLFFSFQSFAHAQFVIEESMSMKIPYAGNVKVYFTKYVSKNMYREEVRTDIDRMLSRIAMGGNKKGGYILNGNNNTRTVYNLNKNEFAFETFQLIRKNNGKPLLKNIAQFGEFPSGGSSSNNKDSTNSIPKNGGKGAPDLTFTFTRDKDDSKVYIAGVKTYKVTTTINSNISKDNPDSTRTTVFEEWFTTDTLQLNIAINTKNKLIEAYGGSSVKSPKSFSTAMLDSRGVNYTPMEGRVIKYTMRSSSGNNKKIFQMEYSINSIIKTSLSGDEFDFSNSTFKQVDKLD